MDYLGGPNVISRVLLKSRIGNQKREPERKSNGRAWSNVGFEARGRGPELRNVGFLKKLEKARNNSPLDLQKECSLLSS